MSFFKFYQALFSKPVPKMTLLEAALSYFAPSALPQ